MNSDERDSDCLFCRIIGGTMPSFRIYEDDFVYACLDKFPITAGHTLVMPKVHHSRLVDLPSDLTAKVFDVTRRIGQSFYSMKYTGVNYFINEGSDAGQVIFHVHCHVIPRGPSDGLDFRIRRKGLTETDMYETAEKISRNMKPDA